MLVQEKMPLRLNKLDASPGRGTQNNNTFERSSHRRKDYSNINLTYDIGLSSQNKNDSIKLYNSPDKVGVSTQVTFGGFLGSKSLPLKHSKIHANIISKAFEVIKEVSPEQHKACEKFIDDFASAVKNDEKFRKKMGFSDVQSKSMDKDSTNPNLWAIPERSLAERIIRAVFSPVTALYKGARNLIFDNSFGKKNFAGIYQNIQTEKSHSKLINDYKNVVGLFNSVEKWENGHRKRFGFDQIKVGEKFMMSDEELQRSLKKRTFDSIDPTKGQYSVKSLSTGNRIVSGIVGSCFYAVDAFNTTMKLSNDTNQSKREGKVKFAQQMIRISLASYFTATALGVFKKQTNKSMSAALLVAGSTVLASEILGRLLVGNPILPTSKRKLEEINANNKNSKNLLLKFGRFLSGESKVTKAEQPKKLDSSKIKLTDNYIEQRYQTKFFGSEKLQTIQFQGMPKKYKKDELSTLLNLVKALDPELEKYYKANILKNLIRKDVINKDALNKPFEEAIAGVHEVEIGEVSTRGEKIKEAVMAPVRWVKNLAIKGFKMLKRLVVEEDKTSKHQLNLNKIKDMKLEDDYKVELEAFKKTEVFKQKSKFNADQKIESFAESFLHVKTKGFGDEIQGIQNSLEWLKKNIRMNKNDKTDSLQAIKNILANKDKNDVKKHLQKLNETMNKMSFVAYAKEFADYDTSKYAVANNTIARVLSSTFLVFDAYNLTMLHSNDKQKSVENGSQYATQEVTRTVMSSYIINATNTVFQSLYNSSIAGALLLTGASSTIVAGISRLAVGNSIVPKTQKQLLEQEEKNKNNPMLKITSRMVGKSMKKMDYGKSANVK